MNEKITCRTKTDFPVSSFLGCKNKGPLKHYLTVGDQFIWLSVAEAKRLIKEIEWHIQRIEKQMGIFQR